MLLLQATLVAQDGTPFILATAHIKDGSKDDKKLNIKSEIPGDKETFKINAIRNMLATLIMMRPATPAVSQGKKPVVVLAGDLNSLLNVVDLELLT